MPTSILHRKSRKPVGSATVGNLKKRNTATKSTSWNHQCGKLASPGPPAGRCSAQTPLPLTCPVAAMQYRISVRKPSVTVRVPATNRNLGPGFDTLGIALKMHNQFHPRDRRLTIERVDGQKGSPPPNAMARGSGGCVFSSQQRQTARPAD